MQPAPGPAFWPGFIPLQHNHYCTAYCPLQAAFYGVICFRYIASALLGPGPRCSDAPWESNSGRNALLIEHKLTTVASTRESVGLGCLLLVVGGWRGFVRIDRACLWAGLWASRYYSPSLRLPS
jgi:hypothetical protein